jgi:dimeric dUTPase (all-alpha-NTP-PPase superfamily)
MITSAIGTPAALENLAEECCELAHASLKLARILRGENPTDAGRKQVTAAVIEEYTDVVHMASDLGLKPEAKQIAIKNERFMQRCKATHKG